MTDRNKAIARHAGFAVFFLFLTLLPIYHGRHIGALVPGLLTVVFLLALGGVLRRPGQ